MADPYDDWLILTAASVRAPTSRKGIERVSGIDKAGSTGGEKSFDLTDRARLLWKAALLGIERQVTLIRFVVSSWRMRWR